MSAIAHIAVVIPARNEEQLLPACISSVLRAQEALPPTVSSDIVIAVDSSTDRSLQIAAKMMGARGLVFATNAGTAGRARAEAVCVALSRYFGPSEHCWLANTDADCEVPENWLTDQLALARLGVQAIAGIVDVVDFSEHNTVVAGRFRQSYVLHADGTHPHVHAANFGVRADRYLHAGGWGPLATAEDHDLWNRLSEAGCRKQSVARLKVITSGRRVGRAPHGFAQTLAAHSEAVA
jgi:glycosyltransferase involved in cell wall biosynthesis